MSQETIIHPSAIIAPGAVIGEGCRIGPFCVVGEHVTLGRGVTVRSHAVLEGKLTVGDEAEIFPFASVGQKTQDLKYRGGVGTVTIGARTVLREYVSVHQPTEEDGLTRVGDDCAILAYCHIAHDCRLGNHVIMSNLSQLAGHVTVGHHVVMGGMSGVHQFCKIGDYSMIGGAARQIMDAVPFSILEGSPSAPRAINKINLQRNGFSEAAIRNITTAYKIVFKSNLSAQDAVAKLRADFPGDEHVETFAAFIESSERGIARPAVKKNL
ncbi:MAG: acyl-ACP--UDP-N-acetylglucosamine O-acyltransferase [Lentisphaeria bacterium]|nr:acyl-ACP--UDP-N-acetylglucosamine O-acyltransferase [Lentisphaeria bacterium]